MKQERYWCEKCAAFVDPYEREWYEPRGEYWGEPVKELCSALICSECNGDVDELIPCETCGEKPATDHEWCADCLAAGLADGSILPLYDDEQPSPDRMREAGSGAPAGATALESGVSTHAGSPIVAAGASGPDVTHRGAPIEEICS